MHFLDILILLLSFCGLIYFIFDRIKYSNFNVYRQKSERLSELNKIINFIENNDSEITEQIKVHNFDMPLNNNLIDQLIKHRDDEDKLKHLKTEREKIEIYLRIASKYIHSYGEYIP